MKRKERRMRSDSKSGDIKDDDDDDDDDDDERDDKAQAFGAPLFAALGCIVAGERRSWRRTVNNTNMLDKVDVARSKVEGNTHFKTTQQRLQKCGS